MKIFSRKFWGTVCIWLGGALLIVLAYDSIRDYFPQSSPHQTKTILHNIITSLFSKTDHPQQASSPARQPPAGRPVTPKKEFTSVVHQTQGNYNVWVWEIKPGMKTGSTVKVKIMHAVTGERGGFNIIAYADTTGDGKPDKEIGKSDFFISSTPGEWSNFEFITNEKRIFVGNTWPRGSNAFVYRGNGPWPVRNCPLVDRFYYRIPPGAADSAGPAYTNMRVSFSD